MVEFGTKSQVTPTGLLCLAGLLWTLGKKEGLQRGFEAMGSTLKPVICKKRSRCNKKPMYHNE